MAFSRGWKMELFDLAETLDSSRELFRLGQRLGTRPMLARDSRRLSAASSIFLRRMRQMIHFQHGYNCVPNTSLERTRER